MDTRSNIVSPRFLAFSLVFWVILAVILVVVFYFFPPPPTLWGHPSTQVFAWVILPVGFIAVVAYKMVKRKPRA